MTLLSYGRVALSSALDPATLALIARFTTPATGGRVRLIDRTIKQLKAGGVWDKLDALWVFAAASQQAALQNWKSASFAAALSGAPTFDADLGVTGTGSPNFIDLNLDPSTAGGSFTQDSATFFAWSRTQGQLNVSSAGWYDGSDGITLQPRNTSDLFSARINQAAATTVANTDGRGLFGVNRSGASATQLYINGALATTATPTSTALNNADLTGLHATAATYSTAQMAALGAGGSLTATQYGVLYTALSRYMQQVGAA